MNLKKKCLLSLAATMTALTLSAPAAFAEEAAATEGVAATDGVAFAEAKELSPQEALDMYKKSGYKYTSQRYGFSIICPMQPTQVLPASMLDERAVGDVLIFDSEEYDIKNAWIIERNAFDDKAMPVDLAKKSEKEQQEYLDHTMKTMPYEFARLTDLLGDGNLGLYAVTAKDWDYDENGDGEIDGTIHSDTQSILTFFRGQYGGHFKIELIDNPNLTSAHVAAYRLGAQTFQEWPVEDTQKDAVKDKVKTKAEDKAKDKASDKKKK